jgi:hypothetical protein
LIQIVFIFNILENQFNFPGILRTGGGDVRGRRKSGQITLTLHIITPLFQIGP